MRATCMLLTLLQAPVAHTIGTSFSLACFAAVPLEAAVCPHVPSNCDATWQRAPRWSQLSCAVHVDDSARVCSLGTNMNGRYGVANMPGLEIHLPNRSGGRFVDVYTPVIESLYSQVAWTPHDVAFPADFVAEFAGKVVNIVGLLGCVL